MKDFHFGYSFIYAEPSDNDPNRPDVCNASFVYESLAKCRRFMLRERNADKLKVWAYISPYGNISLDRLEYELVRDEDTQEPLY